jgi:hypothetical protein
MFITPGALDVVLRFLPSSRPATAESTFLRSDVSADIVSVAGESYGLSGKSVLWSGSGRQYRKSEQQQGM